MNVNTITVEKEEALAKLAEYRTLNRRQIQPEDTRLRQLYRAVSKGARVVNIAEAFRATGRNELGQPKLAIARADWTDCHCNIKSGGGAQFAPEEWNRKTSQNIYLPSGALGPGIYISNIRTAVPYIPPSIRPKIALSNFHILFEVEKWETYPVDPFLLRHISGHLYVVIAEWELTKLEASLLGSMRAGN